MSEKEWTFPHVNLCDFVIYSSAPDKSDQTAAIVTRIKSRAVDLLIVTPRGMSYRYDCWHVDDPNCLTKRETIAQPDRGVFRLSEMTLEIRKVFSHVEAIEKFLENFVDRVQTLEDRIEALETDKPRRPGRPRKTDDMLSDPVSV